jgi:ribosomal subunit interface protein
MHITVSGRHLDVGASLRQHAVEQIEAAVSKYFDRPIDATVTFGKRGAFFAADITVHVGRGIDAHASAEADDAYRAFGTALDHLSKRLRRHKRRLRDHHQGGARAFETAAARQYILDLSAATDEPDAPAPAGRPEPIVVADMTAEIPTLTVGEAAMRLDLGAEPALLFRNAAHGGLNMIYRRADGNVGWVDPDAAPAGRR